MWPFQKKITCYCPSCGGKMSFPYSEVRLEQTKKGLMIILPSPLLCKNCKKEVEMPSIKLDQQGRTKFKW